MSIIEDFEEIRQLIGRIGNFDSRREIKKADDTAYYQLAEADLKLQKFSKQLQSLQAKLQQAKELVEEIKGETIQDKIYQWCKETLEIIDKE